MKLRSTNYLYLNINGLKSHFQNLRDIMAIHHYPDVVALVETNLKPNEVQYYNINNYVHIPYNANPQKNKGSGISLYIKRDIKFTKLLMNYENHIEYIKLSIANYDICIIYNSPSNNKTNIINFFDTYFDSNCNNNNIIIGDINIDLKKKTNPHVYTYLNVLKENNHCQKIFIPTRIQILRNSKVTATLIDHLITNKSFSSTIKNIKNCTNDFSDHNHLLFSVTHSINPNKNLTNNNLNNNNTTNQFKLNKTNIIQYLNSIQNCDWTCMSDTNPNILYNCIKENILNSIPTATATNR